MKAIFSCKKRDEELCEYYSMYRELLRSGPDDEEVMEAFNINPHKMADYGLKYRIADMKVEL